MTGETIAALATPGGTGAVALIRISGPAAAEVIGRATARSRPFENRRATLATLRDGAGEVLDQVLVTFFGGPHSYTGEDVAEVATHGGRLIVRRVLERLLECGARAAGPGEFTERAFFHGKLDLTQAEAVMDLISAQSDLALRAAHEQLEGGLGRRTEALRQGLIETVAQLEAWIDFPEEDIDPESGEALIARMSHTRLEIDSLLATADQGRILREGLRTVICGRPNAGKSSLLNALLGAERAIVSATAGTTRDTIEESLVVGGVPLRVVDTAGLHDGTSGVEEEGIRRARTEASRADLLLVVADGSLPPDEALPPDLPESARRLIVLNKCDLPEAPGWDDPALVRVSSRDGSGLDELRQRVRDLAELGEADWGEQSVAINARHRDCLSRARQALDASEQSMRAAEDAEITALNLREALDFLGEIAGRVDTEEILGSIFSQFCIGK